jgi:hypothetical protein
MSVQADSEVNPFPEQNNDFHLPGAIPLVASSPKQTLHGYYGKMKGKVPITKNDYFTWHNGGPDHDRRFTCIFLCPVTGEWFPSGRYGKANTYQVMRDSRTGAVVVWHAKKADAEHAAAARACDCLCFRHGRDIRLAKDNPYPTNVPFGGMPIVPPDIEWQMEQRDAPRKLAW